MHIHAQTASYKTLFSVPFSALSAIHVIRWCHLQLIPPYPPLPVRPSGSTRARTPSGTPAPPPSAHPAGSPPAPRTFSTLPVSINGPWSVPHPSATTICRPATTSRSTSRWPLPDRSVGWRPLPDVQAGGGRRTPPRPHLQNLPGRRRSAALRCRALGVGGVQICNLAAAGGPLHYHGGVVLPPCNVGQAERLLGSEFPVAERLSINGCRFDWWYASFTWCHFLHWFRVRTHRNMLGTYPMQTPPPVQTMQTPPKTVWSRSERSQQIWGHFTF
jgi:hypothetical protein